MQMTALAVIDQLCKDQSQLIIATHSPILLAYPNATIYQFSDMGIIKVRYEETDQFRITRDFLNNHEKRLEQLLIDDDL